jgi:hypothetical protein
MPGLRKVYDDYDVEQFGGGNGSMEGVTTPVVSPPVIPQENDIVKSSAPDVVTAQQNPHLSGLMSTFQNLVDRAQTAKYARTASMYQGLAAVVANLAGNFSGDTSRDFATNVAQRGQNMGLAESQDKSRLGLANLVREMAGDQETSRFHQGTLAKMAAQLGIDTEKLNLAKEGQVFEEGKFGVETGLKSRALDIEEGKVANTSLLQLQKELGALGLQRTGALSKVYAKEGKPEMVKHWFKADTPNAAMEKQTTLETLYNQEVGNILNRFGVTPLQGAGTGTAGTYQSGDYKRWLQ